MIPAVCVSDDPLITEGINMMRGGDVKIPGDTSAALTSDSPLIRFALKCDEAFNIWFFICNAKFYTESPRSSPKGKGTKRKVQAKVG
jgi:hypothetical protein